MNDNVYYQGGAKGSGNPDVSPQTVSEDASSPNGAIQELNGNEPVSKAELRSMLEELKKDLKTLLRQRVVLCKRQWRISLGSQP